MSEALVAIDVNYRGYVERVEWADYDPKNQSGSAGIGLPTN